MYSKLTMNCIVYYVALGSEFAVSILIGREGVQPAPNVWLRGASMWPSFLRRERGGAIFANFSMIGV